MDISLLGAFLGGLLTLLSPCSAMLLPAFFSYAFSSPQQLLVKTGVFYLGLISTLVPLGVLAGTAGAFVNQHRDTLVVVASVVVIVLGALVLFNVPIPMLSAAQRVEGTSTISVYALGTVYGLAGVCAGPVLGAVLTVAAISGNALMGGITLLFFAAGMALPLLVLALLWGRIPAIQRLVRPRTVTIGRWENTWTGIIGGILTIAVGIFMLATQGTMNLPGILGTSQQAKLEADVMRATQSIPDLVVIAVALGLVLTAWLVGRRATAEQPVRPRV